MYSAETLNLKFETSESACDALVITCRPCAATNRVYLFLVELETGLKQLQGCFKYYADGSNIVHF